MDADLLLRDVFATAEARSVLNQIPLPARARFDEIIIHFVKEIRRVGAEGGFEDVLNTVWTTGVSAPAEIQSIRHALRAFVRIFGATYLRALTDPDGAQFRRIKGHLKGIRLSPEDLARPLMLQLSDEKDPRTFLRKVARELRAAKRREPADFLRRAGELYGARFKVDGAQFLQHILYFATNQDWLGGSLDLTKRRDQKMVAEVLANLRQLWIDAPTERGEDARWFDYLSVVWDAQAFLSALPLTVAQPESPTWIELQTALRERPEVLDRVRADHRVPEPASALIPWTPLRNADSTF